MRAITWPIADVQMPWADVKKEMTVDKSLEEAVADKIGEYVGLKGMSGLSSVYGAYPRFAWLDSCLRSLEHATQKQR